MVCRNVTWQQFIGLTNNVITMLVWIKILAWFPSRRGTLNIIYSYIFIGALAVSYEGGSPRRRLCSRKKHETASVCENRWTTTELMNRNLQWDEEKIIFFPSCTEFGSRLQLRLMFYCFVSNDILPEEQVRQDTFKITCTTKQQQQYFSQNRPSDFW